jgi:hypothetical protein
MPLSVLQMVATMYRFDVEFALASLVYGFFHVGEVRNAREKELFDRYRKEIMERF